MTHIHSRRDGIHMWSHSEASVGKDQLQTSAGRKDLVYRKKHWKLEKHIIRHCACLYNWSVKGFFFFWWMRGDAITQLYKHMLFKAAHGPKKDQNTLESTFI